MKRLLVLAYHFPPVGGAGVQRSVKFVRYLRDLGYESIVVTGPGPVCGRWTPSDETLAHELPRAQEVRRIEFPPPPSSSRFRSRAERAIGLRSPFSRWWIEGAAEQARKDVTSVDLVYATMSPFESAIAAARIAGDLETPWVADLRDPWALDEVQVYPTRLHHKLELFRMRTALSTAAAVIMNTSEAAARLVRQFPEFKGKIVVSIPNGFDPEDFEGSSPPREGDAYRIVHTGYLHTDAHRHSGLVRTLRGGAMPGVNMKARSHIYLLEAIRRVSERHPELVSRVELHLAGVVSEADRAPLPPDLARVHGYLSHASAVALMRSADLLFLPMHDLPPGQRAGIVPGKTYEYLATGVPILAAVPDGDARDLLARSSNTFICQPTDVAAMEAFLTETLSLGRPRRVQSGDRPAFLERYERRHLAEELAAVLDRVLGQRLRAHSSRE